MLIRNKFLVLASVFASFMVPFSASAQEAEDTGASPSASANHDFKVTVEEFLFFQVGSAGATIDEITFAVAGANVGDGAPVAGTGGNAAAGSGASVEVKSNAGQITITENDTNTTGGLIHNTDATQSISYSEISVSSSDATNLDAPTLSDAANNTSQPALNGNSHITNRTATWTFAYLNTNFVPAGTYGGNGNGGRKTFTAAAP